MYELLTIDFISPLICHSPWCLRGPPEGIVLEKVVAYFLGDIPRDLGIIMCQLCLLLKRVASMFGVLARVLIYR